GLLSATAARMVFNEVNNSKTSVAITGLTASTRYNFRIIDFNGSGASRVYNTSATGVTGNRTTPSIKEGDGIEDEFSPLGTVNTISAISPNPAKDNITFNMSMVEEANVTITIHSLEGNTVFTFKNNEFFGVGEHLINIPLKDLAAGAYAISISYGNEAILETFMVMP
ncbi:MAG: T9SS type A sorting domain-containing protein, partial [Candidatus Kapaibacteriota bacterium]